jgi:hypothetical protein
MTSAASSWPSRAVITLTEGQQIQLFTTCLGEPLRTDVVLQRSTSLNDVIMFAHTYEQRLHHSASATPTSTRTGSRMPPKSWLALLVLPAASATASSAPSTKSATSRKFSSVEITERHALGLCFKCDEKFIPGHREACKCLFTIELLDEDDVDPMISIHALTGIHFRSVKTMQVSVRVGHTTLTALLDSSSTHNFLDTVAAARAGVTFHSGNNFTVTVVNDDRVTSPGCCQQLRIAIAGEAFDITCYGLALGSFNMVLAVQWLESLGPVLWDFHRRTMAFVCEGCRILWLVATSPTLPAVLACVSADTMEGLLQQYSELFAKPHGLHHDNAVTVYDCCRAWRPSQFGPIATPTHRRLNSSVSATPCSNSVSSALVNRPFPPLCCSSRNRTTHGGFVSITALSMTKTIKDKILIPAVEELLDKLHNATFFTKLDLRSDYHQVLMHPDKVDKTAFRTHQGLFEFLVMPFGLTNASATFQALMNDVLRPFLWWFALVFFDDILIYSSSWSKHLRHIRLVFDKPQEHQLVLKRSKCFFGAHFVGYLGHTILADGVAMDEDKVQAVLA